MEGVTNLKKFSLVLCGFFVLLLVVPATHAAISDRAGSNHLDSSVIVIENEVVVDIRPNTMSYNSSGVYVTCYITPPEGYSACDIDASSVFLETIPAIPDKVGFVDIDLDEVTELMVKFDRSAVLELISGLQNYIDLTVTGCFNDGEAFFGIDTVNVFCFYCCPRISTPISDIDSVDSVDVSVGYQTHGEKPKHYAVIVGISDYKAIGDLRFCDEDANDWFSYLSELGFDEIIVLGDNTNYYLKYDGVASEYNTKQALLDMVSQAGPRDTIAFISSGHGSGDSRGASLLCMWDITQGENEEDGYFWDYELAAILELAIADQVFVFLDHCFAGGFGEELMSMPNSKNVYFASTCDIMGMGWDAYEYENGLWTYFFLEYTLINAFDSDPKTAMETAFVYAIADYPYPRGAHHPQEYDGDPDRPFLLW